jgi:hypothetical protein
MQVIPSPVPANYRVEFVHPGVTNGTFRLYTRRDGVVNHLATTTNAAPRSFVIPTNTPQGVQELFVRAVSPSGTESLDSVGVAVDITDRPEAPTGVVVVIS